MSGAITCPSCQVAESDPQTGLRHIDCGECQARELAQGPAYFRAATLRQMVPEYRAALARVAGTEDSRVCDALHQRVKQWALRISEFKRQRCAQEAAQ